MDIDAFNRQIFSFYNIHKRILPWRENIDPYYVVVSEIMLQQTQVPRVLIKFPQFIEKFPDFRILSRAPMSAVLREWQGMGYNRRGKYLKEIASIITTKYKGTVPSNPNELDRLPGIGFATARSIVTFIYNQPEIFIETNVRRVFIHHFFKDKTNISDSDIYPLLEKSLNKENPREWYYAVMDYGTYLAKVVKNPNRKSKHYVKQSTFVGSKRQIRGLIIKELLRGERDRAELVSHLEFDKNRICEVLEDLKSEGMIMEKKGVYKIK